VRADRTNLGTDSQPAVIVAFRPKLWVCRSMKQADLIEVLRTYDAALRENGATALFVFGSRARATARPDSDLDASRARYATRRISSTVAGTGALVSISC
jgi:hypothetical protein